MLTFSLCANNISHVHCITTGFLFFQFVAKNKNKQKSSIALILHAKIWANFDRKNWWILTAEFWLLTHNSKNAFACQYIYSDARKIYFANVLAVILYISFIETVRKTTMTRWKVIIKNKNCGRFCYTCTKWATSRDTNDSQCWWNMGQRKCSRT